MANEPIALTEGPEHHFFGYYDKCPWSGSGKYLLAHEVTMVNRPLLPEDQATICVIDLADRKLERLASTYGWSWQQGAMLQWHPGDPENKIIYNDRREGRFVCIIRDIRSGSEDVLPLPVAAVSRDGKAALSINFSRLADERPGYGYAGVLDAYADQAVPDGDGIYLLDLASGQHELIISLAQISEFDRRDDMAGVKHWFNHLLFSPDDKRFIFLHRWRAPGGWKYGHYTRMFTANIDGTDIFCLNSHDMTSHFDWRDPTTVIAWAHREGLGDRYYLFTDRSETVESIAHPMLTPFGDGHCSYGPDRRWVLTDTYPNKQSERKLFLYDTEADEYIELGSFYSQQWIVEARCDLHPRWSRDGRTVCFDSSHSGLRQIYLMDVSRFVG